MSIQSKIFNTNHIRRWSNSGFKIHNEKDGHDYDVTEDFSDEWFAEHGKVAPTYSETDIATDAKIDSETGEIIEENIIDEL